MEHYLQPSFGPAPSTRSTTQISVLLDFLALVVFLVAFGGLGLVFVLVCSVTTATTNTAFAIRSSIRGRVCVKAPATRGGVFHVLRVLVGAHLGLLAMHSERVTHAVALLRRLRQ